MHHDRFLNRIKKRFDDKEKQLVVVESMKKQLKNVAGGRQLKKLTIKVKKKRLHNQQLRKLKKIVTDNADPSTNGVKLPTLRIHKAFEMQMLADKLLKEAKENEKTLVKDLMGLPGDKKGQRGKIVLRPARQRASITNQGILCGRRGGGGGRGRHHTEERAARNTFFLRKPPQRESEIQQMKWER